MADEGKSYRTHVTLALIGLVGVLATALFTNWDKIFPPKRFPRETVDREEPPERFPGEPVDREEPTEPSLTFPEAQREAEKVTAQWVEAWQSGDVATLMRLSIPPFFLDNEILISSSDLLERYQAGAKRTTDEHFSINRIMSGSIAEYKRLGYVRTNDRLLSRIQLSDDDLVVILIVSTKELGEEGIGFYFRRLGDRVEMAGFWD